MGADARERGIVVTRDKISGLQIEGAWHRSCSLRDCIAFPVPSFGVTELRACTHLVACSVRDWDLCSLPPKRSGRDAFQVADLRLALTASRSSDFRSVGLPQPIEFDLELRQDPPTYVEFDVRVVVGKHAADAVEAGPLDPGAEVHPLQGLGRVMIERPCFLVEAPPFPFVLPRAGLRAEETLDNLLCVPVERIPDECRFWASFSHRRRDGSS